MLSSWARYDQKSKDTLGTIPPLLRGLFAAEFRGHWPTYRIGVILLADLAIDLDMRKYGRRILEEIMPQVCFHLVLHIPPNSVLVKIMPGDDIELRAFACYILSRCIVASSEGQGNVHVLQDKHTECVPW
jgi:hypothetical protein